MAYKNCTRVGCKDVLRSFLVANATYESDLEIPRIKAEHTVPTKLIPFSKAIRSTDYSAWVHFFEDDVNFERLWNRPNKYLPILQKFAGVITPDFSLYRDMPLVMQQWNIYRSRALGHWLQENGVQVIVNVRWGDKRTYPVCCSGVPNNAVICVGSHGCIKLTRERNHFSTGLNYVVRTLHPKTIIVYGAVPEDIFEQYTDAGISIIHFESDFNVTHKKAVNS